MFFVACARQPGRPRQSSANQYDCMHSTIDASSTGQTTPGTIRDASTNNATDAAIFTNAQPSMLSALITGESDESAYAPGDERSDRRSEDAEDELGSDDAPGGESGVLLSKALGLSPRQRRVGGVFGLVIEGAPRRRTLIATGHRVEGRARDGDFQHSPRLYV